jgi:hypothetical protein
MTTADTIHPDQEIEWLKRQLTWLLDKEAIRKVKQQYCRYSDNGRFDDFEKLFTDDYHSEINGPPTGDGSAPQLLTFPSREAWVSFARTQGALRARVDATAGTEGPDKAATGFKGASGWNRRRRAPHAWRRDRVHRTRHRPGHLAVAVRRHQRLLR